MRLIVTFLLVIVINVFPTFAQEEVQHQKYAIQLKKAVEKIKRKDLDI